MFIKRLTVLAVLITASVSGTLLSMKTAEAQLSEHAEAELSSYHHSYCGHGTFVRPNLRIRYLRSRNTHNGHFHLYFYDFRHGRDYSEWKRCPSHSGHRF